MAILKMQRIDMLALSEDKDRLLHLLQRAGCVELTELDAELADQEWASMVQKEKASVAGAKSKITNVQGALDALKKYAPKKSGLFIMRREIAEEDFLDPDFRTATLEIASKINECVRQISQSNSYKNRLGSQKLGLMPWLDMDVDLGLRETEFTRVVFGVCPAVVDLNEIHQALEGQDLEAQCFQVSSDREQHYLLLVFSKVQEEAVMEALRPHSFNQAPLKDITGVAEENIKVLDDKMAAMDKKIEDMEKEIASYGDRHKDLQICADQMVQELAKEEARNRMATTGTLIYLRGWVPAAESKELEEAFTDFDCAITISEPNREETPPTKLSNGKIISSMDMVTEMYSLPHYNGIDPNPLIFPFFAIFYGMMLGDIAYGIILIIASQIIIRKYKPKGILGNILKLATICGVTTAIWGFLSGALFGNAVTVIAEQFFGVKDFILYVPLLDPLTDPLKILYLAVIMGAVQLFAGMCIQIYICFRDGRPLDALFDVGSWWLLFAGIGVLVLKGTPVVIYAGIAALVLTQGRHKRGWPNKIFGGVASLYNITGWLGDVLSYTRLMALMLATTVIASVVNILGSLPGNIIAFVVIFIFGHVFNIGINVIGSYVHTARLQYLEYFSKFYQSGGRPFRPLQYNTKYVDIIKKGEADH
jgi:V/A-type H+/Na+-transporting ATPase subunit I